MSYVLAGSTIHRPVSMDEGNSTIVAANRTLSGANTRDYMGSNKRIWTLTYKNLNATDFATINTIYQNYLSSKAPVSLNVTEGNYPVSNASVHVDLPSRKFNVPGSSYLSDFNLVLTEA